MNQWQTCYLLWFQPRSYFSNRWCWRWWFSPHCHCALFCTSLPAMQFAGGLAWPLEFIIQYCILENLFSIYFPWNEMKWNEKTSLSKNLFKQSVASLLFPLGKSLVDSGRHSVFFIRCFLLVSRKKMFYHIETERISCKILLLIVSGYLFRSKEGIVYQFIQHNICLIFRPYCNMT